MDVVKKPLITEKLTSITDKYNKYGFIVDRKSNKVEIKSAIESMYGVKVESVNTVICRGKAKIRYTKKGVHQGRTNTFKKAIVSLSQGETIDFFSNI